MPAGTAMMSRSVFFAVAGALLAAAVGPAQAGKLDKIRASGEIVLGYRVASAPFSSAGDNGVPVGFSIDLCMRVVAEVRTAVALEKLAVRYVPVTAEDRIEKVESGAIDIECGSTSRTI